MEVLTTRKNVCELMLNQFTFENKQIFKTD